MSFNASIGQLPGVYFGDILIAIMPTHTFYLLFSWNPKDELAPLDASAEIILKANGYFHTNLNEDDDEITITTECTNPHELEVWVARLRKDLDEVLKAGLRNFAERDRFRDAYVEKN